jgi:hypothetical protein
MTRVSAIEAKELPGMDQHPKDTGQGEGGEPRQAPLIPEVIDRRTGDDEQDWGAGAPFEGQVRGPFAPYTVGGGRVRVYGCSPGCLILVVVVSLILTLLLNAIF